MQRTRYSFHLAANRADGPWRIVPYNRAETKLPALLSSSINDTMQQRKDEIQAKKAKLAELKRQREVRQQEFSTSRQSVGAAAPVRSLSVSEGAPTNTLDR